MNQSLLDDVFSQVQTGQYIRLGWQDINGTFQFEGFDNYDELTAKIENLKTNPDIISIWFTPNSSISQDSHTELDVPRTNWLFVDIDDISYQKFADGYNFLKPTYVIDSGHGIQLYWKLREPVELPNDVWSGIEKALIDKLGADRSKNYASALLRVPDTFNRKHLLEKYRDKGYTSETLCKVIEANDVAYALDDFEKAGLAIQRSSIAGKIGNRTTADLARVRQYCPVIEEAFKSIESDGNSGTTGHNKRLAVASIVKHTTDDEAYVLDLFGKVADFDKETTLKHYRSIDKDPITCQTLQDWGLCSGTCQLMQDINKKSPIVFAYRQGIQLEYTDGLLKRTGEDNCLDELFKRTRAIDNPLKQSKMIARIQAETSLTKQEIKSQLLKTQVVDEERPYLVNGDINEVKAAQYIIDKYQIIRFQQDFYKYRDGIWNILPDEEAESLVHHEIKKYSNNGVISEVINAVKREALITPATIESQQDKYVIAAANGLLDTRTLALRGFRSDDYMFKKMNAEYNPQADCPEFLGFIDELFEGDTDKLGKTRLAQELFGYLLIPDYTLVKKMFYLYGPKANNGKSSLIDIVRAVIGNEYFDSVPMGRLDGFLLKRLNGKHANVVGDQDANTKVPDGIIKQLVGGMDEITADVKNKEAIKFINTARLIFAVNKLPYSEAKDEGYFTRTVILTFNNEFLPTPDPKKLWQKKADPDKIQRIKDNEKSGILNWLLEGLDRLICNGKLTIPQSTVEALGDYRINNSSVLLFVNEECKLPKDENEKLKINRTDLYDAYREWCRYQGFKNIVNAHTFYETIIRNFEVTQIKTNTHRFLEGIAQS